MTKPMLLKRFLSPQSWIGGGPYEIGESAHNETRVLNKSDKIVYFVVGMHRSGTSALARTLNILGCALPNELLETTDDNPTGYWESREIVDLSNSLLSSFGLQWDSPLITSPEWFSSPIGQRMTEKAAQKLQKALPDSPHTVVKDPRISRLLPIYSQATKLIGRRTVVIIALRHPFEVVASLRARHGWNTARSLLLWLIYSLEAERYSRNLPRSIARYPELLHNWESVIKRVGRDICFDWRDITSEQRTSVKSFLNPSMRHHSVDQAAAPAIRGSLPDLSNSVHHSLAGLSSGNYGTSTLDKTFDQLIQMTDYYATIHSENETRIRDHETITKKQKKLTIAAETRADEMAECVSSLKTKNEQVRERLDMELQKIEQLTTTLNLEQQIRHRIEAELQHERSQSLAWRRTKTSDDRAITELRKRVATLTKKNNCLTLHAKQCATRISDLQSEISQTYQYENALKTEHEFLRSELDDLRARLSQTSQTLAACKSECANCQTNVTKRQALNDSLAVECEQLQTDAHLQTLALQLRDTEIARLTETLIASQSECLDLREDRAKNKKKSRSSTSEVRVLDAAASTENAAHQVNSQDLIGTRSSYEHELTKLSDLLIASQRETERLIWDADASSRTFSHHLEEQRTTLIQTSFFQYQRIIGSFRSAIPEALWERLQDEIGSEMISRGAIDPKWYLQTYPDVVDGGIEPAFHYLNWGVDEFRLPINLYPRSSKQRGESAVKGSTDANSSRGTGNSRK